jgi:hypothetical protein
MADKVQYPSVFNNGGLANSGFAPYRLDVTSPDFDYTKFMMDPDNPMGQQLQADWVNTATDYTNLDTINNQPLLGTAMQGDSVNRYMELTKEPTGLGLDKNTNTQDGWWSNNGLDAAKIGLGVFGLINDRQQLGLAKKALQDQLENSKMQRELTADQLRTQAGVRSSLARAFGGSTKPYEKSLGLAKQYANKDA